MINIKNIYEGDVTFTPEAIHILEACKLVEHCMVDQKASYEEYCDKAASAMLAVAWVAVYLQLHEPQLGDDVTGTAASIAVKAVRDALVTARAEYRFIAPHCGQNKGEAS